MLNLGKAVANILVIDDEETVRESLKIMLEDEGHSITLAEDGAIGIKLFKQKAFNLVICDLFMPNKEGFETLSDIKNLNASTKVLVISGGVGGSKLNSYLDQAKILGADAILAKPFSIDELEIMVNQLLEAS